MLRNSFVAPKACSSTTTRGPIAGHRTWCNTRSKLSCMNRGGTSTERPDRFPDRKSEPVSRDRRSSGPALPTRPGAVARAAVSRSSSSVRPLPTSVPPCARTVSATGGFQRRTFRSPARRIAHVRPVNESGTVLCCRSRLVGPPRPRPRRPRSRCVAR